MSVESLAALITLATIPPLHALTWSVMRRWRGVSSRVRRAAEHADAIFLSTIAPAAVAVCGAVFVTLPAFILFEPSGRSERPGVLMAVSASVGAAYVVTAVARMIKLVRLSRRCTMAWMSDAQALPTADWGLPAYAIDTDYPVVAVAGVIRPRLLIDRRLLVSCSDEELRAIAAHERAHVRTYDNARRAVISACVGSKSASAQEWRRASEFAADESAAITPDRAAVLAGALVKIARLAAIVPAPPLPFATIHDGGALEMRVQRLLSTNAPPACRDRRDWLLASVAVLSITMAAWGAQVLAAIHSATELLVRAQ
jgi:Zn-dependent protease with chaperone function